MDVDKKKATLTHDHIPRIGRDFPLKELCYGFYGTHVYLPFSALSRRWRRWNRQLRGKPGRFLQSTRLPEVSWRDCTPGTLARVWEHKKENGNVRISELTLLSLFAADCRQGSNLMEIGTFDGRTTLNLALNAPASCHVYTLDLPPQEATKYPLDEGERHLVEKPAPGARYEKFRGRYPATIARIHQLLGDSATYDYTPYANSCSLVFVDGSHAYAYAVSDTLAARTLVEPGGMILWHDYGIWKGVTQALDELEQREHWGLRQIRGTSLVVWKNNKTDRSPLGAIPQSVT